MYLFMDFNNSTLSHFLKEKKSLRNQNGHWKQIIINEIDFYHLASSSLDLFFLLFY